MLHLLRILSTVEIHVSENKISLYDFVEVRRNTYDYDNVNIDELVILVKTINKPGVNWSNNV